MSTSDAASTGSDEPRRRRAAGLAFAMLAPSLIFLVAFTYWPVAFALWQSLALSVDGARAPLSLSNYVRLFSDPHFARAAVNNLVYAAGTILPSIGLGLAFALALQKSSRVATVLRTLIAAPLLLPLVAASALFSFIYLPGGGLLDFHLAKFGFTRAHNWLGDPSTALVAVIAVSVWKNTGYYMLFFLAGLATVPAELLEAARLDGAGPLARLWHVTLPLLGPTFGFVAPVALINALVQIDHVVTLTQGGPDDSTNLVLYYIYQQAAQNGDAGLGAAATVISVAGLMAAAGFARAALERNIHYAS